MTLITHLLRNSFSFQVTLDICIFFTVVSFDCDVNLNDGDKNYKNVCVCDENVLCKKFSIIFSFVLNKFLSFFVSPFDVK